MKEDLGCDVQKNAGGRVQHWLAFFFAFLFAAAAGAEYEYVFGLDRDFDASTGCAIPVASGSPDSGFEYQIRIALDNSVSPSPASTPELIRCESGVWQSAEALDAQSAWVLNTGLDGADRLEVQVGQDQLGVSGDVRLAAFALRAPGDGDAIASQSDGSMGVLFPPWEVPALSPWAWLVLAFLLVLVAFRFLDSQALQVGLLLLAFGIGARGGYATALSAEGGLGDWEAVTPMGTDPSSDVNDSAIDLLAFSAYVADNTLFLRVDVVDVEGACLALRYYYYDQDGDGYGTTSRIHECAAAGLYRASGPGDCNDHAVLVNPGAAEVCDGVDNNCNTDIDEGLLLTSYPDADGDGYGVTSAPEIGCTVPSGRVSTPGDCNDDAAQVNPGAAEVCDNIDNDCNNSTDEGLQSYYYYDQDGDGYGTTSRIYECAAAGLYRASGPGDCNDHAVLVNPGAAEVCDGVDNNCNTDIDEGLLLTSYPDADGDGYGVTSAPEIGCTVPSGRVSTPGDCNDDAAQVNPGAAEVCDNIDNNCNNSTDEGLQSYYYYDQDGDGYGTTSRIHECAAAGLYRASGPGDCNDHAVLVNPGAAEVCDGVDNNCNTDIDEGLLLTSYPDADGDGYGVTSAPEIGCTVPSGRVSTPGDCNDDAAQVNPGAAEVCDNIDNDCNNSTDEGLQSYYYYDQDGDGYGTTSRIHECAAAGLYRASGPGDCNDHAVLVNPGAAEVCDGVDNNCNTDIDEGLLLTSYPDADGDGYGVTSAPEIGCTVPSGRVSTPGDCNDDAAQVNPGAAEVCDNIDNNCNNSTDEGLQSYYYYDQDGDGYGTTSRIHECAAAGLYRASGPGDCNDHAVLVNPGAAEVCDGVDNNCNTDIDEGLLLTSYPDADGDGYGVTSAPEIGCTVPSGRVSTPGDCNDDAAQVNPGAAEVCDNIDNNCNNSTDEGLQSYYYYDQDGDGYGTTSRIYECAAAGLYRASGPGDCNDHAVLVNPGAAEVCDGVDNNCNTDIDEGLLLTSYPDADGDGYGVTSAPEIGCTVPSGRVSTPGDCNDDAAQVNPGAAEVCDNIDNDCNNSTDEGVSNDCGGCAPLLDAPGDVCDAVSGEVWVCASDSETLECPPGGGSSCAGEAVSPQNLGLTCGGGAVADSWLAVQACSVSAVDDPCDDSGCYAIPVVEEALLLIGGELRVDLSGAPSGCGVTRMEVVEYWACAGEFGQISAALYDADNNVLAEVFSPNASPGSEERILIVESASEAASAVIRSPYGCVRSVSVE